MKLFLASEAKHPETFKRLEKYVGGFEGKKLGYIPTAANGDGWESWREGGSWKLVNNLKSDLDLILLEDFRNNSVIDKLLDKEIIWVAGGMLGYLSYWARRCSFDKYLDKILEKIVYVGSSAGSMLLCNDSEMVTWDFVDKEYGANVIKPLGKVEFDIYPHYDESLYKKIKSSYTGKKLYLIKNGEEIIVEDGVVKVTGEERIITK